MVLKQLKVRTIVLLKPLKSEYSSSLAKEFNNIEKETRAKLLREDLISYIYKLNTAKYQKLKNMKIESEIDQFVKKKIRVSFAYLKRKNINK